MEALGSVRDPQLVDRALDYTFSGPLRANELLVIPSVIARTRAGRERAYTWMTANYARLAVRLPADTRGFIPLLASGCSASRLEAARAFFALPEHRVRGTERTLGRVAAEVEECLALRAREGEAVTRFLDTAAP